MGRSPSPGYRRQKRKSGDLAFVELSGVRHYLGAYGSDESRTEYHRLLAEWEANGRELHVAKDEITVVELSARFLKWAESYYRRADGTATGEAGNFAVVVGPLNRLYGKTPAAEFGPRSLKCVRDELVKRGLARTSINRAINRLRLMFRWAVEEELLSASVHEALRSVRALRRGRSDATESAPVRPVPRAHVEAVRPHVSRQVLGRDRAPVAHRRALWRSPRHARGRS